MENTKIFEMADRLKTLQEEKKNLEAQTKALGAEIAELDLQLSDAMTEAELDRFSRNGSTFYLKSRLFASPAAGRKDEMMQAFCQLRGKSHGIYRLVMHGEAQHRETYKRTEEASRWHIDRARLVIHHRNHIRRISSHQ